MTYKYFTRTFVHRATHVTARKTSEGNSQITEHKLSTQTFNRQAPVVAIRVFNNLQFLVQNSLSAQV